MIKNIISAWLILAAIALFSFSDIGNASAKATYRIVHAFAGKHDGNNPNDGIIVTSSGALIGTTTETGKGCCGTVFQIAPSGDETVLHAFSGPNDGHAPSAGLLSDGTGNFYGTTMEGGEEGYGTVFKLAADGTEEVLYSFRTNKNDGASPVGKLVSDKRGNLFGVTTANIGCFAPCGTVFRLTPDGKEKVLKYFNPPTDGAIPYAGLIIDSAGNLYGTTAFGGSQACGGMGCGTVFKMAPDGTETVLHAFLDDGNDGISPYNAGVVMDGSGNLYGVANFGGTQRGGVVYEITSTGAYSILYNFEGGLDGATPEGDLIFDNSGNLYGTTTAGGGTGCGGSGCGTVFKLTRSGEETILHRFRNNTDGSLPSGSLTMTADGLIYGTTRLGPRGHGHGVVFEITP